MYAVIVRYRHRPLEEYEGKFAYGNVRPGVQVVLVPDDTLSWTGISVERVRLGLHQFELTSPPEVHPVAVIFQGVK